MVDRFGDDGWIVLLHVMAADASNLVYGAQVSRERSVVVLPSFIEFRQAEREPGLRVVYVEPAPDTASDDNTR